MSPASVAVSRTVKDTVRVPFLAMARAILPKGYQLSLVLCADTLAKRMNRQYRKKTYKPNVLSFTLSPKEGEIFLNIRKAAREARGLGISTNTRIALLFVHGCFHLIGHDHSDRMEALEDKTLRKFKLLR